MLGSQKGPLAILRKNMSARMQLAARLSKDLACKRSSCNIFESF